jgi:hypothetical protein
MARIEKDALSAALHIVYRKAAHDRFTGAYAPLRLEARQTDLESSEGGTSNSCRGGLNSVSLRKVPRRLIIWKPSQAIVAPTTPKE